jgi:hypothetical protein
MKKPPMKMMTVYVDADIGVWLDQKASEGYNKSSLIRRILHKQMARDGYIPTKHLAYSALSTKQKKPIVQPVNEPENSLEEDEDKSESIALDPIPQSEETVTRAEAKYEEFSKLINEYRANPWAVDRIEDQQQKAFINDIIAKIEAKLPVAGPMPEWMQRGRKVRIPIGQVPIGYKPQRTADGHKIGTPQTGAKYEDMETDIAVVAWFYDNPGEPMPRWLSEARIQWIVALHKKTHKY